VGRRAIAPDDANTEAAADESRRSVEAAQQLSACFWVTLRFEE
jgi:hypothetical protein